MKFSKVLAASQSEMPELNSMFLRYKELKKQLKSIPQREQQSSDPTRAPSPSPAVSDLASHHDQDNSENKQGSQLSTEELRFISTLNEDLGKFNNFFMEQEEAAVIQLQALTDELDAQQGSATSLQLKERLVQFHGSCIMLMHWSLLNYAAVAKILKKHDKRTGLLLRAPCLSNVLQQPFNSTSVMSRLVKRAEEQLQKVTPQAATCKDTSAHQQLQQQLQEQQRHVQQQHAQMQDLPQAHAQQPGTHAHAREQRSPQAQPPQQAATAATGAGPSCFSGPACQVPLPSSTGDGTAPSAAPSTAAATGSGALSCGASACTQLPGCEVAEGAKSPSASPQGSSLTSLTSQLSQARRILEQENPGAQATLKLIDQWHIKELQQQGGMGCQALRALEMWKTLQATASTPSTVVPEGQPVGCPSISRSQRTSEHGAEDSKRSCGKRSRTEDDGQQSASYLSSKRQSQEREVHV